MVGQAQENPHEPQSHFSPITRDAYAFFKKPAIACPQNLALLLVFRRYAIAVFFKNN